MTLEFLTMRGKPARQRYDDRRAINSSALTMLQLFEALADTLNNHLRAVNK